MDGLRGGDGGGLVTGTQEPSLPAPILAARSGGRYGLKVEGSEKVVVAMALDSNSQRGSLSGAFSPARAGPGAGTPRRERGLNLQGNPPGGASYGAGIMPGGSVNPAKSR